MFIADIDIIEHNEEKDINKGHIRVDLDLKACRLNVSFAQTQILHAFSIHCSLSHETRQQEYLHNHSTMSNVNRNVFQFMK